MYVDFFGVNIGRINNFRAPRNANLRIQVVANWKQQKTTAANAAAAVVFPAFIRIYE